MHYKAIMIIPIHEIQPQFIKLFDFQNHFLNNKRNNSLSSLKLCFDLYLEEKWKPYLSYVLNDKGLYIPNRSNEIKFDSVSLLQGTDKFCLHDGKYSIFARKKDVHWDKTREYLTSLQNWRKKLVLKKYGFIFNIKEEHIMCSSFIYFAYLVIIFAK